jgi:hypothetical protein
MTDYIVLPWNWGRLIGKAIEEDPRKDLVASVMDVIDTWRIPVTNVPVDFAHSGPFRQGSKIRRHIYAGPTEHDEILIAVGDVEKAAAVAAHVVKLLNADAAGAS